MVRTRYAWVMVWGGALGLLSGAPLAHGQQAPPALEVADCVKVLRSDSVHMFFDPGYALTPPACAAIRREGRIDLAGDFAGEVRDYRMADNGLANKIQYANGVRDGRYEQYHANHQMAMRGQFTRAVPSGTWQFWYPNGRPQQTLEWTGQEQPSLRIVAYWDSTGRQQVTNGAGEWQGTTAGAAAVRYGGRVAGGYQQGEWKAYGVRNKALEAAETFQDGRFVEGRGYVGTLSKPMKYKKAPTLEPQLVDASLAAEPLHLGKSCEELAALRAAAETSRREAAAMVIMGPKPPRDVSLYQTQLLKRVQAFNNLTQWMPQADGQSIVVTADIDAQGRIHGVASDVGPLASAFTTILADMGNWRAATVNGNAVPGKLKITIRMYSTQLQSTMQANVAYPLPAASLTKKSD